MTTLCALAEGEFVEVEGKRVRQGQGTLTDGPESYSGGWENDLMTGEGSSHEVCLHSTLYPASAPFTQAKWCGLYNFAGQYKFASGAVYLGGFLNGKFDGEGKYVWADGAAYTGGWKEAKMHGKVSRGNVSLQRSPFWRARLGFQISTLPSFCIFVSFTRASIGTRRVCLGRAGFTMGCFSTERATLHCVNRAQVSG